MGHGRANEVFAGIATINITFFGNAFALLPIADQIARLTSLLADMDNELITDISYFSVDFYPLHGTWLGY